MNIETEIQKEIESLREKFTDTKALYREVCALLFFRYGITPTASKLYQYVRKGSMNTPADAVAKFWEELRSKARVEIDRPDLPNEVKAVAADAIQALWIHATERARNELATTRLEMQVETQQAREAAQDAKRRLEDAMETIEQLRAQLDAANDSEQQVKSELEAERRTSAATAAQCQELQRQVADLQEQAAAIRSDFAGELDKGRAAIAAANERSDTAERRALLEIDQERQARSRADKLVETLRNQVAAVNTQLREKELEHANIVLRLQAELDRTKEVCQQLSAATDKSDKELQTAKASANDAQREIVRFQTEAQTLRGLLDARASDGKLAQTRRSAK